MARPRSVALLSCACLFLVLAAYGRGEASQDGRAASADTAASQPDLPPIPADAPVRFPVRAGDRWGYIDREGDLAVDPRFESAAAFHEGLAAVRVADRYGYADTAGTVVIEPRFVAAGHFSEGRAAVIPEEGGLLGYVDTGGQMVIPARFAPAAGGRVEDRHFASGRALARPAGQKGAARHGYLDRSGAWAIEPAYPFARSFGEGLAPVSPPDADGWVYVDTAGAVALEGPWDAAHPFSEGLAAVDTATGGGFGNGWRYIDREGTIVLRPTFGSGTVAPERVGPFSEGLAAVYFGGPREWRYITASGEDATFVQVEEYRWFDEAGPFRGGLARVVVEGRDGPVYIDRRGEVVWPRPDRVEEGAGPAKGDEAASSPTGGATACADIACFEEALPTCEAVRYRTVSAMGGAASYEVLGPDPEDGRGCRVQLTYLDNPNPDWVDRPLRFTLETGSSAPSESITQRLRRAVRACLTGDDAVQHRCSGPLAEELGTAQ